MSDTERKRTRTGDDEPAREPHGNQPVRRGVGPSGPSGPSGQAASPEMQHVETTSDAARLTGSPARLTGSAALRTGDGAWDYDDRLRAAMGLGRPPPAAQTPAGPGRAVDAAPLDHAAPREASRSAVQLRAAEPRPGGDVASEFDDRLRAAMGLGRPPPAAHTPPDGRAGATSATPSGESLQLRAAADAARGGDPVGLHEAAAAGTRGTGGSLPHQDRIQAAFGDHDITGVSSHTGPEAAAAAKAMGAEAYATGNAVAFASPNPSLHTAAHEAAHIVQQRSGVQLKGGVGEAGDAYERHANAVAVQVVLGNSAEGLLDQLAGPPAPGRSMSPALQRKPLDGRSSPELERPHPPSPELLDGAEEPAPPAPEHAPAIASPGKAAAGSQPSAEGHPASSAATSSPAHATVSPGSLPADDHRAEASTASSGSHGVPDTEVGHAHGKPAGPTPDRAARPASSTAKPAAPDAPDAPTARRPQDRHAEARHAPQGAPATGAAQPAPATGAASPAEGAPRDVHVGPEDQATAVSVRAQTTAHPPPAAPVAALTRGSLLEHAARSTGAREAIAPAPARATPPAAAPPAAGPGDVAAREAAPAMGAPTTVAMATPAAAQPIRFQAEPEAGREPDRATAEAQANAFASASQQRVASLRTHVETSARALEPRLAAADQGIEAAKAKGQAAIRAAMAHLRTDAAARVAAATAEITQQHERTVGIVHGLALTQKTALDATARTATETVSHGEAQRWPELDTAYAAGDQQFRRSGEAVGREAMAIGADHRSKWMAQLDGESTILSGPVHDNKLKARAHAADQVAQAYRDQLVAAANQQADAAQRGKARDREALAAAASAQRDAILTTLRSAHAGIDHAQAAAIAAADHQRASDLKLLAAQHASTLKTISRKEAALLEEVSKHAAGHKQALRTYVQAAVAHCSSATNELVASHDASMAGLRAQAAATPAPGEPELAPGLRQQHDDVQHATLTSEAKFTEVFAGAAQQIAATERDSIQGLASFAANTHQVTAQITGSIAHTTTGFVHHSKAAFAGIEQQYHRTADAITAAADKTHQDAAASSNTAFSRMTAGLANGFGSAAAGLETNLRGALKDLPPQIQKSADDAAQQVQPRWKKVLKVLVTVAVIVTVAVVAGPAVIGALGAIAGGLGAGAAAGAIGVVVGGAAVGAASGAVLQISNNVIDGNKWHEGVGTAAAIGAISGVFGGVGGLAAKGLTSLGIRTLVTLGFDGAGSVVGNLATGQPLTFEGIALGLAIGLGMSLGAGALAKFGGRTSKLAPIGKKLGEIQERAEKAGEAFGERAVNVVRGSGAGAEAATSVMSVPLEHGTATNRGEIEPTAKPGQLLHPEEAEEGAAVKAGEVEPTAKPGKPERAAKLPPRVAKTADKLTTLLARDPDEFVAHYRNVASSLTPDELTALKDTIRTRGRITPASSAGLKPEQLIELHRKRMIALREIGEIEQMSYHGSGSAMMDGLAKTNGEILSAAELERRGFTPSTGEGSKYTPKAGPKEFISVGEGESGFGTSMAYADATKGMAHYNPRLLSDAELQANIDRLENIVAHFDSVKNEVRGPMAAQGVREKDHFVSELDKLKFEAKRRTKLPADAPERRGGHADADNHPLLFEFDLSTSNVRRELRSDVKRGGALGGEGSVYGPIDLKKALRRVYVPAAHVQEVEQKLAKILGHQDFEVLAMEAVDGLPQPGVIGSSRVATYKMMGNLDKESAAVERAYEVAIREGRPLDVMLLLQEMTR